MNDSYGRDIDLNLLRVFLVVAESGSVTQAAGRLYLTQPAVSAALRRLTRAVGTPLFARQGRGLVLTSRGQRLLAEVQPHLRALVDAALTPTRFDPRTSDRTFRVGLSDAAELWLLPRLLRLLGAQAPHMRVVSIPVQFRTVAAAMATGLDAAVTVADELPAGIRRRKLWKGGFVCVFDPRQAGRRVNRGRGLSLEDYFARHHVVVSYNGDLRGVVEDVLQRPRKVRCSVSSFANVGAVVDGTDLVATLPGLVARQVLSVRPHLASCPLPFRLGGSYAELLWPAAADDDEAGRYLRERIVEVVAASTADRPGA